MKTAIRASMALSCLLCSSTVFADAHDLSYSKIVRAVDTVVTLAGVPHTMVAMPVRTLVSGDRYAIVFPAPRSAGSTFGTVTTIHDPDPFATNITIDSFPAQVQVTDALTYILGGGGVGGYNFIVTGSVTVTVLIDLGDTIMSISNTLQAKDAVTGLPILTSANTGSSANAVPFAEYGKYVDKVSLVNALDAWIDYIRIIPK